MFEKTFEIEVFEFRSTKLERLRIKNLEIFKSTLKRTIE